MRMRCDRGTTLATILVLMCCIGGTVGSGSIATHKVLVQSVYQSSSTSLIEVVTTSRNMEVQTIWLPRLIDGDLLPLSDIEEMHNLPPPFCG